MIIRHRRVDTLGVQPWAVVTAILAAATRMLAGTRFEVLVRVNGSAAAVERGHAGDRRHLVAIDVIATSLIGGLLGGLAGMRHHRRAERAGTGSLIEAWAAAGPGKLWDLPLITAGAAASRRSRCRS
jgi:hypothetical protein